MKTYFNYNQVISSKEAAEAIAMVKGNGPIVGFGSATIDSSSNEIKITPLPSENDPMYNIMLGKKDRWNIVKGNESSELPQTNFVGITRDGYVFASDEGEITLKIQGAKGSYDEVLVFAYHTPVTDPIENPVTFMAFWSESNRSFYELYHKSIDPYYPLKKEVREINFNNNSGQGGDINYENLMSSVKDACTYYLENSSTLVLMGIYGTGSNAVTGAVNEPFALVPYEGEFPNHLYYNVGIHNSLKQSIGRLEDIVGANTSTSREGITTIADLLYNLKQEIMKEVRSEITLATLPIGSIILWQGDTIPEGWDEFTDAAGRVVVGFQSGGIKVPNDTAGTGVDTVMTSVGSLYNPVDGDYNSPLTYRDLPSHRHGIGVSVGGQDNSSDERKTVVQNWDQRDSGLNGSYGYSGSTESIRNGGLYTSPNFINDTQGESETTQWNAIKLPKAIALRYIIKRS